MSDKVSRESTEPKPAVVNPVPSVSVSASSSTLLPSSYAATSMLRQPSASTSAPLLSASASSSALQFSLSPAPEQIPMLPSTSKATFAPSGELLIDGLGVDGRNLSKGELGWAEPFSPVLTTTPTIRRFSTRPSLDPIAASASLAAVSPLSPVVAPQMSAAPSASLMLPDPVNVFPIEDLGTCGVQGCSGDGLHSTERIQGTSHSSITIHDIIERRTCRPISLQDLRNHLLSQRASRKDAPSSPFATQAQLPDLSLLGGAKRPTHDSGQLELSSEEVDQEKTLTNSSHDIDTTSSTRKQSAGPSRPLPSQRSASAAGKLVGKLSKHARSASTGDEVDALDFVAVFNRYNRRFHALSKAQRARSPNPASYVLAPEEDGSILRRTPATAAVSPSSDVPRPSGEQGVKVEVLFRQASTITSAASQTGFRSLSRLDSTVTGAGRKELTLYPASQPLREQFEDILRRFIGALRDDEGRRESEAGQTTVSVEEKDEAQKGASMSKSTSRISLPASPRLRWMVEIGLLSEQQISLALAEAEVTTHPQVLAPLADKVAAYLNGHIVPGFLSASTSNLSRATQLGRLGVGLVCLMLAILFTVLLAVNPSPFRPRGADDVSRWWRLLTAPLWCAGVGYVLAAWTGVCVWLTIRGNHEPGQDDDWAHNEPWQSEWENMSADEHHQPPLSKQKISTWTTSTAAAEAAPDPASPWRRPDRKSLMAPELLNLLRRIAFLKPLAVAGPELQQVTADNLEKGPDDRIEPAPSSGITFANLSWAEPASSNVRRESLEERVSPTVSRAASLSGIAIAAQGPRQLEPVHEVEKWSPSPSAAIAAVGPADMSSIGQVASVIDGASAIGISIPPPPVTPRMPSSSGGSFSSPPFSSHSVSPNGGMWRNPSLGSVSVTSPSSMSAPAISVRAKKVPVLPVAVGLVRTNIPSPAITHRSPNMSRASISPVAGSRGGDGPAPARAVSNSQADVAGLSYAASLYNVATCGPRHSAPRRLASSAWVTIRRATGFAVNTKPVLDSRVRAAQQRAALQSLFICFGITLVILIIIIAVP